MIGYIENNKISCPLCKEGLGTIDIDSRTVRGKCPQNIEGHCTKCDIWFRIIEVTDEEKVEMFNW